MTDKEFRRVVGTVTRNIKSTLVTKGSEYARGDRLSNFKRAGELSHSTPEMALRGMLTKHIISIYDMIDDLENGKKLTPNDWWVWNEKIIDSINYHILLRALLTERFHILG